MVLKTLIKGSANGLVENIREFSRQQKNIWQKVPYLALQADGRWGYSDQYSRAYQCGYWALDASLEHGSYTVFVDLESGELLNPFNLKEAAFAENILELAMHADQIDASLIVEDLEKRSKLRYLSCYDPKKQEKWRKGLLKDFKLKPDSYKRRESIKIERS